MLSKFWKTLLVVLLISVLFLAGSNVIRYVNDKEVVEQSTEMAIKELNTRTQEMMVMQFKMFSAIKLIAESHDDLSMEVSENRQEVKNDIKKFAKVYNEEHRKPSYEYLKSCTVVIEARAMIFDELFNRMVEVGWMGTGTVIKADENYTYILTNKHVAPLKFPNINIYVIDDSGNQVKAKIIKNSKNFDLSIIRIEGKLLNKQAAKNINTTAKITDRVYIAGHHLGRPYTYGEGCIAGYDNIFLNVQVPALFGDSGSGVFNQNGEIVGVLFAVRNVPLGFISIPDVAHALVIPANVVKEFVKGV